MSTRPTTPPRSPRIPRPRPGSRARGARLRRGGGPAGVRGVGVGPGFAGRGGGIPPADRLICAVRLVGVTGLCMWDAAGVDPVGGSALPLGVWGCAAMCPAAHGSYTARVPPDDDAPFELGTDGPLSILVGVDGSTTSQRAGWYAAGLARRQAARVTAVYVAPVSAGGGGGRARPRRRGPPRGGG